LGKDDDADKPASGGGATSIAAIPKTKPKAPKAGPEPEPVL
jgi:cell division protease FtsH